MTEAKFVLKEDTENITPQDGIDYIVSSVQLMPLNDEADYEKKKYDASYSINDQASTFYKNDDPTLGQVVEFKEWLYEIPEVENPIQYESSSEQVVVELPNYIEKEVDTDGDGIPDSTITAQEGTISKIYYKFPLKLVISGTEFPDSYKVKLVEKDADGNQIPRESSLVQSELQKPDYVIQNADHKGIQLKIYQYAEDEDGTPIISTPAQGVFYRSLEPFFKAEVVAPEAPPEVELTTTDEVEMTNSIVDYDDDGNPIYEELESGASTSVSESTGSDQKTSSEGGTEKLNNPAPMMFKATRSSGRQSDKTPQALEDYATLWKTNAEVTALDGQCLEQKDKCKFIKISPSTLNFIIFTQGGVMEEVSRVLAAQLQNICAGAGLRLAFNMANTKARNKLNQQKEWYEPDGEKAHKNEGAYNTSIKGALIAITECFNALHKLASFNEKFYYDPDDKVINSIFVGKDDKNVFKILQDAGALTTDESGKWKFQKPSEGNEYLQYLDPEFKSLPNVLYVGENYSPGYDYYTYNKNSKSFTPQNIDEKSFDPTEHYYVGLEGEYDASKALALSTLQKAMNLCVENYELYAEFKNYGMPVKNWRPIKDPNNKYTLTPHRFYLEGLSKHRPYQETRMRCGDICKLWDSNWFAVQCNSEAIGNKYKSLACKFMSLSTDVFKQIPKQIAAAAQAIVEPMSAIVVTPIGPGAVTTNIMQILGTVTSITTAVSAITANVMALLALLGELGLDQLEVFAAITGGVAMLSGLLNMITNILTSLPSL